MGYWDSHPMAGDPPLDALFDLSDLLFTKEERNQHMQFDDNLYKKRLENNLEEAAKIDYLYGQSFVLPFKIAEYDIQISDEDLSEKIKQIIGDGGASRRGYDLTPSSASNGYNEFQSPYDFARALQDHWDKGMKGEVQLSTIGKSMGLLDKVALSIDNGNTGLINKK